MTKVLITGDVHIMDYRQHNLFDDPQFRLKQFDKLADRIVNLAAGTKAEALIIAGDFLHVANPRPYIVNAAFDFLNKVTEELDVFLTHGQHDFDSRTKMSGQHTLLRLCELIPRVYYYHHGGQHIGNARFHFLGWEPNWDELIRDIPECDVLIGHAQPKDVRIGQRGLTMFGGENIPTGNEAPFKLAFLGDIHYHQHRDNWVIPGTPIQHSYNDHPDVGLILLDTSTLEWKRVPTIVPKHWEFLQLLVSDEPDSNPYVVTRAKKSTASATIQTRIERSLDTLAVIESAVEESQLETLHTRLLNHVPKTVREEVDLNFSLDSVKIQNFRSIGNFEWDEISEGVKLVSGRNGTGKSSLVNALMFALAGQGSARNFTKQGTKNMSVEVSVIYGRLKHTIRRGWATSGKTQYLINDEEQPAENQRALVQKIGENLPFLQFVDLFYHDQHRPGFLASYNYAARVDLVSRVLGLKIVNELHQAATLDALHIEEEMAKLREKIASVTAIADQEDLVDFTIMENVDEDTEENFRRLKQSTMELLDQRRREREKIAGEKAVCVSSIQRTTAALGQSNQRRAEVETGKCYTCGELLSGEKHSEILEQIGEEIRTHERTLNELQAELDQFSTEFLDAEIEQLESRYDVVTTRYAEVIALREQVESLAELKNSIDLAKQQLGVLTQEMNELETALSESKSYRHLMDANGPVMRSLLTSVSEILTSDTIRVRAHKALANGELRPDFGVDMKVAGQGWVAYDELSGGQKTVADLTILEKLIKLVGGVGILIFDETFKHLDNENLELVVDIVKEMQCHSTFIISHADGFPYWDLAIQTGIDKSGSTVYTLR